MPEVSPSWKMMPKMMMMLNIIGRKLAWSLTQVGICVQKCMRLDDNANSFLFIYLCLLSGCSRSQQYSFAIADLFIC